MNERDTALASLWDRTYRAALTRSPSELFDDSAFAEARRLAAVTDLASDIRAAHVLGWFRWLRYLVAPEKDADHELSSAIGLLKSVFDRNPYAVPGPLQRWYLQAEANSYASRRVTATARSARQQEDSGRLPIFDAAVRSFIDAQPRPPAERSSFLMDAALMVRGIAGRGADQAVLAEAADLVLAALGTRRVDLPSQADARLSLTPHAFLETIEVAAPDPTGPSWPVTAGWPSQPMALGAANGAGGYESSYPPDPGMFGYEPDSGGDAGYDYFAPEHGGPDRYASSYADYGSAGYDSRYDERDTGAPVLYAPGRSGAAPPRVPLFTATARPTAQGSSKLTEPQRRLWAQVPERVGVSQRIPLLVRVLTTSEAGISAPLKPFPVPRDGRKIEVAVYAPGFELTDDSDQELYVPSSGDSEPIRFGLRAVTPGLHQVRVTAFASGTFLGQVELQVSVEIGAALSQGVPRQVGLPSISAQPGEVTLQVNKENGVYSFQLTGTSWYPRVLTQSLAADPTDVVERILAELRAMANGDSGFTDPQAVRRRIRNLGTKLWSDIVPDAVRRQFWDQVGNIKSFVVMSNLDMVPWELLHPVDQGCPELGFLAEYVPVIRRVYERTPAYSLPLPTSAYVVPPRSPDNALEEIEGIRAVMGSRVRDLGVVTRLDELQELFSAPPGLLHFACHNTFSRDTGSVVRMDGGPVRPDDLEEAKRRMAMASANPLVFFNACRTAGEIYGFTEMSGWASQFMAAGAGAFIGTLWPVRSQSARVFATSFYDALVRKEANLGEASLYARKSVAQDSEDPTWLAYTVYGSPAATVPSVSAPIEQGRAR